MIDSAWNYVQNQEFDNAVKTVQEKYTQTAWEAFKANELPMKEAELK